jgi:hypothetical protein
MDLLTWLYSIVGYDWIGSFRPATLTWLAGGDPYLHTGGVPFVNPPWLLPFMAPLALLPPSVGAWALNALAVTGIVALCVRYRRPWLALPLTLSFPMLVLLYHAQVDGFVLWGLALGGPLGLLLLLAKPQTAGLVVLLWLWQAFRAGGLVGVVRLVWWPALVMLGFTLFYPQWLAFTASATRQTGAGGYNFFPLLVLPGLVALAVGLWRERASLLAAATVMVAPYLRPQSTLAALTMLAAEFPWLGVILAVLSWWPLVFGKGY